MDDKLGQILLEMKLITKEQLEEALLSQREMNAKGGRQFKLGEVLLFTETISLPQLQNALRRQTGKAERSREIVVAAKRREREAALQMQRDSEREESTFLGRLKSLFSKKN